MSHASRTLFRACSHGEGPLHNCDYVEARNKLIPFAVHEADERVRKNCAPGSWNRYFHDAMNRLWRESQFN